MADGHSAETSAMTTRIDVPKREIEDFCQQNRIRKLALSEILRRRAEIHPPKGLNPRFRADVLRTIGISKPEGQGG